MQVCVLYNEVLLQEMVYCNCSIQDRGLHCSTISEGWGVGVLGLGKKKRKGLGPGCTRRCCTYNRIVEELEVERSKHPHI